MHSGILMSLNEFLTAKEPNSPYWVAVPSQDFGLIQSYMHHLLSKMWYDKVFEIIEVTFLEFIGKKEQK